MKIPVCLVKYPNQANFKVCFVDNRSQEKNEELLAGAVLVDSPARAKLKLCIVKFPNQADILIMPEHFPDKR